jgi:hypothetical protein
MKIMIAVGSAVAIPLALCLACSSSGKAGNTTTTATAKATTSSAKASPKASNSVSHELGSQDASKDVTLGAITIEPTLSIPQVPVTVTNHSSKRSNYIIEVSLESADGKTQLDTTTVAVENLEPRQASKQTAQFVGMINKPLPAGAKTVLKSVDRLAS